MKRRLLASLLTLVMMLSLLPTAALAADEGSTSKVYTRWSRTTNNYVENEGGRGKNGFLRQRNGESQQ